jgi:hypothetical protein
MHRDFFVGNSRKTNDECILILVIYWKKTGLLHTRISNHNIIYSNKRRASTISDVRTLRGPNCISDHYLVRTKIRQRSAKLKKVRTEDQENGMLQNYKIPI